jgi:hypothetical protein
VLCRSADPASGAAEHALASSEATAAWLRGRHVVQSATVATRVLATCFTTFVVHTHTRGAASVAGGK